MKPTQLFLLDIARCTKHAGQPNKRDQRKSRGSKSVDDNSYQQAAARSKFRSNTAIAYCCGTFAVRETLKGEIEQLRNIK